MPKSRPRIQAVWACVAPVLTRAVATTLTLAVAAVFVLSWDSRLGSETAFAQTTAPTHDSATNEEQLVATTLRGPVHFVSGFSARNDDGTLNVVVEIPSGTSAKWEVTKKDGVLEWEFENGAPRVVQYLPYPGNYGMVPRTLLPQSEGGDGDPLDVLVLGRGLSRGQVISVTAIGVLRMLDRGERDDKILAVSDGTPFAGVRSLKQLDHEFPGALEIIQLWFSNYKGPGKIQVEGFAERDQAEQIVDVAARAYEEAQP